MRIEIRVPNHPLALQSVLSGLTKIGRPKLRERDGSQWISMRVDDKPEALNEALEVGTRLNVLLMRAYLANGGEHIPSVYELAVGGRFKYMPEPKGREWWQTWVDNLAEREGDCEDIAMHQASWYRVMLGVLARATTKRTGRRVYHAVVEHPGGAVEDPSLPLGLAHYRLERARRRALAEARSST